MGRAPSPRCVLFSVCKVLYLPPLRTQHPVQSGRADPSGANVAPWGERRLSIPAFRRGECQVGDHLVARPAVVHVAERDLELAALGGLQVLGEDGAFLDVLVLGRTRRLDVES